MADKMVNQSVAALPAPVRRPAHPSGSLAREPKDAKRYPSSDGKPIAEKLRHPDLTLDRPYRRP